MVGCQSGGGGGIPDIRLAAPHTCNEARDAGAMACGLGSRVAAAVVWLERRKGETERIVMVRSRQAFREQVLADADTPAAVRRALRGGAALESIHLDDRGRWWHEGSMFENQKLSQLFSRSVFQTEGGVWFLQIGNQSYPITVACTGYFADRIWAGGDQTTLALTTGELVDAGLAGWMTDGEERLGVRLVDGRDVRLLGAAHQAAVLLVSATEAGWKLQLGQGDTTLLGWPDVPRGIRLTVEASEG